MIIHSMKVHSILQNRRVESNFNKLTEIPFLLYSSMESGIFLIGVFILYIYGILLTLLTTHSATTNHISIIKGNTVNCIVNQVIIKLRLTLFTLHISYSSSLWKSNQNRAEENSHSRSRTILTANSDSSFIFYYQDCRDVLD